MSTEEKFVVKIGEEDKTFIVKFPTSRIEAEANMHASRVFSKLIREKREGDDTLLLRNQLDEFLKDKKVYTEDDIKEITETSKEVTRLEEVMAKGGIKKSEGRTFAIELRRNRYKLLVMLSKRMEYDKNTIEHHSEGARINYIISKCLCSDDGVPVFNNVDDYEFDDTGLKNQLIEPIRRIGTICSSYDTDFEAKLPENKFLVKYGYCNDKFNLVDANGNLVNEKGERINDDGELLDENGQVIVVVKEIGEFLED